MNYLSNIIYLIFTVVRKDFIKIRLFTIIKGKNRLGKYSKIGKSYFRDSEIGDFSTIKDLCSIVDSKISDYVVLNKNISCYNTVIGPYTYISDNAYIAFTKIGSFCSIGHRLMCAGANHPTDWVSTSPIFYSNRKQCGISFSTINHYREINSISIGNDVWIGNNVTILGNIKIGDGAIIAAGAVVTKDIPDFAIYGGVPAKLIRFRFEEEIISGLKKIEWWKWSKEKLISNVELFRTNPIELIKNELNS